MPTLYIVEEAADCEGRSYRFKTAFTRREDAERLVAKLGGWGAMRTAEYHTSYADWEAADTASLRQKALAKLSAEEKAALGVKE